MNTATPRHTLANETFCGLEFTVVHAFALGCSPRVLYDILDPERIPECIIQRHASDEGELGNNVVLA